MQRYQITSQEALEIERKSTANPRLPALISLAVQSFVSNGYRVFYVDSTAQFTTETPINDEHVRAIEKLTYPFSIRKVS